MNIQLTLWNNDSSDESWLACDSVDALWYLTPALGPTSTLVLHHAARWLSASEGLAYTFGVETFAQIFGVTPSVMFHTLKRLQSFGLAECVSDLPDRQTWKFRTKVPPMSRRFARRMPADFLAACPYLNFDPTNEEMSYDQR
jgi:hypothetical protein